MKSNISKAALFGLMIFGSAAANASTNSATIFPAEGNGNCNDYSDNSIIKEMTLDPISSTFYGADGHTAELDPNTTATSTGFLNATTKIDYAVLKDRRTVTLVIYPSGGVDADSAMEMFNAGSEVGDVVLCYGLGNEAEPEPEMPAPLVLPSCDDLNLNGGLDGINVTCPTNGQRSVVMNMELDSSFYNTDASEMACVCNSAPLQECDPNLVQGETRELDDGTIMQSCLDPLAVKRPIEVTTHIEYNNDPYFCTTSGGNRYCFAY